MEEFGPWQTIEVLITVKAYPNPSRSQSEAACIVGVRRDGGFVRLYPVPFRALDDQQRFKKYQWIRVRARKPKNDPRPETLRPDFESIEVLTDVLPSKDFWKARKEWVIPLASRSLCDVLDSQKSDGTSVGFFKPAEVLDFDWEEEESKDWTQEELSVLMQEDMFLKKDIKLLEKIPYKFRYQFRCEDCQTKNPHHVKIVDWELAAMFRRFRRECGSIEECLKKTKDRWLGELCGPDKDTYFFTGNMQAYPQNFLVLGIFWPGVERQIPLL